VITSLEKPGTPEELVHFGTKGMKWGLRKTKGTKDFHAKFVTGKSRASEIHRARVAVSKAKLTYERNPNDKTREAYLNHPDRATSLRLTRGEKVVAGLLYGLTPSVIVPAAVAGTTAYRVGKRRAIEK
jgi:hypothetical protein